MKRAGWGAVLAGCEAPRLATARISLAPSHEQVLELQAPGKRVMAARDFVNGLKGRSLVWQPVQAAAGMPA